MFEKHKNTKQETPAKPAFADQNAPGAPVHSGRAAVIGPGIHINGDITGNENLVIEGKVDGKIKLASHQVSVGQGGKVNADITAKIIKIDGHVKGDLIGTEKVIISRSGNVQGNIVAPKMTLEEGAIFKGSIDMDPGEPAKAVPAKPTPKEAIKPVDSKPKSVVHDAKKENGSYSLSGG
jgi:cytoskeletal protein CcmA (bactofilin family)